jgi:hypothetical protein
VIRTLKEFLVEYKSKGKIMSDMATVRISRERYDVLCRLSRSESVRRDEKVTIRDLVDEAVQLLVEALDDR